MTHSFSAVLPEINASPSPFHSINTAASELLGYTSPFTARVLRSQRHVAVRAATNVASSALLPTSDPFNVTRNRVSLDKMPGLDHSSFELLQSCVPIL